MKKKLEVRTETRGEDTWIYTLSGSLYGNPEGYSFQNEVRDRIASGAKKVVIDLAAVDKIDSSGIGILVATMWSASHAGSGLALAALSKKVEQVLGIAMLLDHIEHADTVEAALDRLGRTE